MEVLKEINNRRSIRKYSNKKVTNEEIEMILKAAMQAPSARNQRPWHFLVLTKEKNNDVIKKIASRIDTMKFIKDASFVIIFMFSEDNLTVKHMAVQDMSSAVTLSLVEAASLNIGSCWCGVYPKEDRMNIIKEECQIKGYIPFALVSYGYPKEENDLNFINRFEEERIHYLG